MQTEELEIVESLQEKMHKAFYLAMDVAYSELSHKGNYFTVRDCPEMDDDRIWDWADGLVQDYAMKRFNGECSLQASIDFDIEKFEESVDMDIAFLDGLLEKFGKPVRLTKEEMRSRGYIVR
jgi:enolase